MRRWEDNKQKDKGKKNVWVEKKRIRRENKVRQEYEMYVVKVRYKSTVIAPRRIISPMLPVMYTSRDDEAEFRATRSRRMLPLAVAIGVMIGCVGSMLGGLAMRFMGATGVPSNSYRFK